MDRLVHPLYQEDLEIAMLSGVDWKVLDGARVGISGATGMVGTFLVDLLMRVVHESISNLSVVALGRNESRAMKRLPYFEDDHFSFQECDIAVPGMKLSSSVDIVIHLASTTHPLAYSTQPISTITSNVIGLQNLFEWQIASNANGRFCFASSVEIYGENRGDVDRFDEEYCGYLNCNTLRAGYPESKRLGEAMCQAYGEERRANVYIPRLPRIFGPTLLPSDTKALSQFLSKAVAKQSVVLKSEGLQEYSYLYLVDAVTGLLWVLTRGEAGEAYNVSDPSGDICLRDLAQKIAHEGESDVVFELPTEIERRGYSTATKALLDGEKLRSIGWRAHFGMDESISRVVRMLREIDR